MPSTPQPFDWNVFLNQNWIIPCIVSSILSILLIYNAIQQRKIQKQNIKIALFEKRIKYYEAFKRVLSLILKSNGCKLEYVTKFLQECSDIDLYFDKDVIDYFHEFHNNSLLLCKSTSKQSKCENEEARLSLYDEHEKQVGWFDMQLNGALYANFKRYIDLKSIGIDK